MCWKLIWSSFLDLIKWVWKVAWKIGYIILLINILLPCYSAVFSIKSWLCSSTPSIWAGLWFALANRMWQTMCRFQVCSVTKTWLASVWADLLEDKTLHCRNESSQLTRWMRPAKPRRISQLNLVPIAGSLNHKLTKYILRWVVIYQNITMGYLGNL